MGNGNTGFTETPEVVAARQIEAEIGRARDVVAVGTPELSQVIAPLVVCASALLVVYQQQSLLDEVPADVADARFVRLRVELKRKSTSAMANLARVLDELRKAINPPKPSPPSRRAYQVIRGKNTPV